MAKTKTTKAEVTEVVAGEQEVAVCRRRNDRRATGQKATPAKLNDDLDAELDDDLEDGLEDGEQPKKVQRRRQIDPTTCERDYTNDEIEFMHALDAYKRSSGRMFPTCSEILEVVRGLGYAKPGDYLDDVADETADGQDESEEQELEEVGQAL